MVSNHQCSVHKRGIAFTRALQQEPITTKPTNPAETVAALLHHGVPSSATYYDLFTQSVPLGPPPQGPFDIDSTALKREFLQLQSRAHPDLHPEGQRPRAAAVSARVNEAYRTLEDPLRRAQYLLDLADHKGGSGDESTLLDEEDMLMEVMEARERAEEAGNDQDQIDLLRKENHARIESVLTDLSKAFAQNDLDTAAVECARLRYWVGVEDRLRTGSSMH
jgi:molecular chaperone HscB